jgi:hypothetical protein
MGGNTSSGQAENETKIDPAQSPFLKDLYAQGQQQFNQFAPNQGIANSSLAGYNQGLNAQPGQNPYLDSQLQTFQDQLGFANQQSGGEAGLAGAFGGGRQGVAEHLNAQSFQSNVGSFLGQTYASDQALASGERQNALGQASNVLNLQAQGQQQNALGDYANIIGSPTLFGEGSSSNSSLGLQSGLSGTK